MANRNPWQLEVPTTRSKGYGYVVVTPEKKNIALYGTVSPVYLKWPTIHQRGFSIDSTSRRGEQRGYVVPLSIIVLPQPLMLVPPTYILFKGCKQ